MFTPAASHSVDFFITSNAFCTRGSSLDSSFFERFAFAVTKTGFGILSVWTVGSVKSLGSTKSSSYGSILSVFKSSSSTSFV